MQKPQSESCLHVCGVNFFTDNSSPVFEWGEKMCGEGTMACVDRGEGVKVVKIRTKNQPFVQGEVS